MRIRRGLLFWGLLLIPFGAIPLLVRANVLSADRFTDVWRLWPLVLIVVGLVILLARTRASLIGTAVAAIVLGTFGGVALAAAPSWGGIVGDCSLVGAPAAVHTERSDAFSGSPSVVLDLRCGSIDLRTAAGNGWQVAAEHRGPAPVITSSGTNLTVRAPQGTIHHEWSVRLPAGPVDRIDLTTNAATGSLQLDGMDLGSIATTMNAGDLRIDAGSATVDRLDATVNAGRLRVALGSAPVEGGLTVNAGSIDLCVPPSAGLRLTVVDQLTFGHNLAARGLTRGSDGTWTRPAGAGGATMSLRVEGNAAALTLDPDGGCR